MQFLRILNYALLFTGRSFGPLTVRRIGPSIICEKKWNIRICSLAGKRGKVAKCPTDVQQKEFPRCHCSNSIFYDLDQKLRSSLGKLGQKLWFTALFWKLIIFPSKTTQNFSFAHVADMFSVKKMYKLLNFVQAK